MILRTGLYLTVAAIALASASGVNAGPPASVANAQSGLLGGLAACRTITSPDDRLACFDREAARIGQAVASREVVVLSRQDVVDTHRSLFGFSLPKLPFFGDQTGEAHEMLTNATGARSLGYGKWQIVLSEGGTWETTEGDDNNFLPHAGSKIRIRRGVLGSYLMNIDGARAVSAHRVN